MGKNKDLSYGSRKKTILTAAFECFVEFGMGDTGLIQVANRAKVDPPLIKYYYPHMENLWMEVVGMVLDSLKSAVLEAMTPHQKRPDQALWAYLESTMKWQAHHPDQFKIWMYFYYLATFKKQFSDLNTQIRTQGRERISLLLYGGIEKKFFTLPPNTSVDEAATFIQGFLTGQAIMAASETQKSSEELSNGLVQIIQEYLRYKPHD